MDRLITDRLIIRSITEQDYSDICEYGCDEETGKYMIYWPKSKEDIRKFTEIDIARIFNGLYSTQRPNVMDSLLEILKAPGGVSFFKKIFNQLKDKKQDIDSFHNEQKSHIKEFKRNLGNNKLVFGKNTISQIAHFCEPTIYPISNTKSQNVIFELFDKTVDDNYREFEQIAIELCNLLQAKCEEVFQMKMDLIFKRERYIILDDFIEYVYDDFKKNLIMNRF